MNRSRISALCALLLVLAFAYNVDATTITLLSTQKPKNESPATVQNAAAIVFNNPNIIDAFRAEPPSMLTGTNAFGTFSVMPSTTTPGTYTISFNLQPGYVLAGVFAFGGNLGGNFYSVNSTGMGLFGGIHAPFAGKSGTFAGLSHLDFFVMKSVVSVPDGGWTLSTFGAAFVGLIGLRRYVRAKTGAI